MTAFRAHLRKVFRDERGFSLIEMLTAMSILLIVFGTLTILMVSATKSEVDLTQRVQAQQQGRLALEMVRHQIHRACVAVHTDLASGTVVLPTVARSNVRLTLPNPDCATTTTVTWCTSGSGSRWALRRIAGTPTTCALGRLEADYITTSDVFQLVLTSGRLAALNVNFPIDLDPLTAGRTYRLEDSLVLRNSTRAL